ncbi:hypothetical protein X801_05015 [Opisthorchis viverrini]|uniref:Uncharacterized protein n=2 Tax=Opisthorchis viverrini TaxID=6198 RepID=A0A1S8WX79_OPIVI|nr:hypothetical protein T265_06768 [Opisthorchis viverrini]KER25853.1 hypothetical protein T265_06768 [Opisthorchis viverrini]OON19122.1 hypothetical protein X801_05015 [Opisthorchis viverrini]
MDSIDLLLVLTSNFLQVLQSCSQFVINCWSVDKLRDILHFSSSFQKLFQNLGESEKDALTAFVPSLQPHFPHLPLKSSSTLELENAVQSILHVLKENTHLTQNQRDCIFEFCLDESSEAIRFQSTPTELFGWTTELANSVESHLFISHLVELNTQDPEKLLLFLDSSFVTDPEYLTELIIRTLEHLTYTFSLQNEAVAKTLLHWLSTAVLRSKSIRSILARCSPQRLRDLALCLPGFEACLFNLFQTSNPLDTGDDCPSTEVLCTLVGCLANSLPCGPKLLAMVENLAALEPNGLWSDVCRLLSENRCL